MREDSAPLPREESSERLVPPVPSRARHLPTPGSALSQSSRAFGNRLQWFFGGGQASPAAAAIAAGHRVGALGSGGNFGAHVAGDRARGSLELE